MAMAPPRLWPKNDRPARVEAQAQVDRRRCILMQARHRRLTLGAAIAAIFGHQHVVAGAGQPLRSEHMRADVLGIAVQEQNRAFGGRRRQELPGVQFRPVGRGERQVMPLEPEVARIPHLLPGRLKDEARATGEPAGARREPLPAAQKNRPRPRRHSR